MKTLKLTLDNVKYRRETLLKDVNRYIEQIELYQKALKKAENELLELSAEEKIINKVLKEYE